MSAEVKQRKKKLSEEIPSGSANKQENTKVKPENVSTPTKTSTLDFKCILCALSLSMIVLQQNSKFSIMEEKIALMHGKTSRLSVMEEQVEEVSKKCASVHLTLDQLGAHQDVARANLNILQQDVGRLKERASDLSAERSELRTNVEKLGGAVDQIETRASTLARDFANKVASVRTELRRTDGLRSELETLLVQVSELEERASRAERTTANRIGDVLAGSIERVAELRAASERNVQSLERLGRRLTELDAADRGASERLRELESGRARLLRTVSFASELKPKVSAIKKDFGVMEPRLDDLTFRIGVLAEELGKREEDISQLRHAVDQLASVETNVSVVSEQESVLVEGF
ncbi:inhibitor of nuclear factor kappa-B kinase-interacting protein isoform X4 [Stigmatopora nigra]